MIGPEPRVGGGISAVTGMILDSTLPSRCRLTYLAEGTRAGGLSKLRRSLAALAGEISLLARRRVDVVHLQVGGGGSFYRHTVYLALARLAGRPVLFHWHIPGDAGGGHRGHRRQSAARLAGAPGAALGNGRAGSIGKLAGCAVGTASRRCSQLDTAGCPAQPGGLRRDSSAGRSRPALRRHRAFPGRLLAAQGCARSAGGRACGAAIGTRQRVSSSPAAIRRRTWRPWPQDLATR